MKTNSSRLFLATVLTIIIAATISPIPASAAGEYRLVQIDANNHIPDYYAIHVPWFRQEKTVSCGPACLKMVFARLGWTIDEGEIQQAANMEYSHGGTWTGDMVRAAHFSNLSSALDNASLQGYTSKPCGSDSAATSLYQEDKIEILKRLLLKEKSPILLMWYRVMHRYGHYRVLRAYDDRSETLYFADPMGYDAVHGVNWTVSYEDFVDDWWSYSGYWLQVISDWDIEVAVNDIPSKSSWYEVNASISTGIGEILGESQSALWNCSASLTLPDGWQLHSGTNRIAIEFDQQGVASAYWEVSQTEGAEDSNVTITARGFIEGEAPSYDSYKDRICTSKTFGILPPESPGLKEINASQGEDGLDIVATIQNAALAKSCQLLWRENPIEWQEVATEKIDSDSYSTVTSIPKPGTGENESLQLRFILTDNDGNQIWSPAYEYSFYEIPTPVSPMLVAGVALVTIIAIIVVLNQIGLLRRTGQTEKSKESTIDLS